MAFSKVVVVLCVTILGISWIQASAIDRNQYGGHSVPPGYDDETENNLKEGEYLITEESDSVDGDSDPKFRNKYETQIYTIYNYITSPKDKYIEIRSHTSYTFGPVPYPNGSVKTKATLNVSSFNDTLEKANMRNKCVLLLIQIALKQVNESCDELKEILNPYIVEEDLTTLQNASGLAGEENKREINIILLNIASAKLLLQDLQRILDAYLQVSSTSYFIKNINGLSLDELVSYTVSVMTSVRGSWIDWKLISYYANNMHNKT